MDLWQGVKVNYNCKNKKCSTVKKNFREIKKHCEWFIVKLIWRNFVKKHSSRWWVNTVRKLRKFALTIFGQKFRESNGLTKELIWRNIFSVRVNFSTFPQCGKTRNSLPVNFFYVKSIYVKFVSKTLIWRNFCEKKISTVCFLTVVNCVIWHFFVKMIFFRKINLLYETWFHGIFSKNFERVNPVV